MNHLAAELDLRSNDLVEVTLTRAANVMLMDRANYGHYTSGRDFTYYGGHFTETPAVLAAPRAGRWQLVIDLGGAPGTVSAGYRVIQQR
jgi:hypothetical protein